MAVYHADALVIRSKEFGESDRLLTLFSREKGKIKAVAKGVRKPKSKQRGGTQLFTYADFLIHQGKTLDTVNQASPKESFRHIWGDFEQNLAATAIAELLDAATVEGEAYPALFALTLTAFFLLDAADPLLIQNAYALRLLSNMGYQPELNSCVKCGTQIKGDRIAFGVERGGILCPNCQESDPHRYLRAGSIAFMRHLLQGDFSKLDRLRWSDWMKQELGQIVQALCEFQFEHTLRSWNLERQITQEVDKGILGGRPNNERGNLD